MPVTIYISGAITSDPYYQFKFDEAEKALKATFQYAKIINPAKNEVDTTGMDAEQIWRAYMEISREQVKQSDIVATLDGWQLSRGATEEVALAKSKGILVCSVNELIR
jgi:methionine-rich copper-binding protein CopC